MTFHSLTIDDIAWAAPIFEAEDSISCDGAFGTFFLWGDAYGLEAAEYEGRILLKYQNEEELFFSYPAGGGDLTAAVTAMKEISDAAGVPLSIGRITEKQKNSLEAAFPGKFTFTENRDAADYVYDAAALATLSGKKLHSKKNHTNRFEKTYPDWHFEPMENRHFYDCLDLLIKWSDSKDDTSTDMHLAEQTAIARAFKNFEALKLEGGILYVGETPIAFTLGELVGGRTFDSKFEKADMAYDAAFAMINKEFAKHLTTKFPDLLYINREEDMGLENLRKAKLSYKPAILLEKWDAVWA